MRVAIYCRLSEEDRNKRWETEDSLSIQNQKSMLTQYALERGWEIWDIYSDDDYTGADRGRPEFNRLLRDAQARRFDIILCKTQSRFTRELELVEKYIHGLFPLWGIRFISIVDHVDTDDRANKKARQINGLINEWYLEDMSENIRSVLTNRRQNGLHIGAFALYGYRKDPDRKGHLLIDPEAATVVYEVFNHFAAGWGKTAIARLLNERGVPNPAEYKRRQGLRYKPPQDANSTLWTYSTVAHMLTNAIYTGCMVQGRYGSVSYKTKQNRPRPKSQWYIVPGTHEPIIDAALWARVQARIAAGYKPFGSGQIGLFAGKVRCAACGYVLRSTKNHGRHYLQCPTRRTARDACPGAFISVEYLTRCVDEELKRLTAAYLDPEPARAELQRNSFFQQEKERLLFEKECCEKKLAEYTRGLGQLYLDRARGELSEQVFTDITAEFERERKRTETALARLRQQLVRAEEREETISPPERLTREMVESLIDFIRVGRRIPGTREVPLEIHWNF